MSEAHRQHTRSYSQTNTTHLYKNVTVSISLNIDDLGIPAELL